MFNYRNFIIIGVTSFNLGCNSVLIDDGKSEICIYPGRILRIIIPGEKLPSVFADVRGKSVMDWIEKHTAGATFCRRSQEVKEVKGGESLLDLTSFIYIIAHCYDVTL